MFYVCEMCGRCYDLKKFELTADAEEKMSKLEKSWFKQGELTLCCREGFDNWNIKRKMKK